MSAHKFVYRKKLIYFTAKSRSVIAGYTVLPENNLAAIIDKCKSVLPPGLITDVHLGKEFVSLAHSLAGRYLLGQLLRLKGINADDVVIALTEYKRPVVKGGWCHFSISHSGWVVICVLSETIAPGIDIELIKSLDVATFQQQFTTDEFDQISKCKDFSLFYQFSTAKEAISKAAGKGFYIDFDQIIPVAPGLYTLDGNVWQTKVLEVYPGYCCTVAAVDQLPALKMVELNIL